MLDFATPPGTLAAFGSRLRGFQELMRRRVQDILVVSSLYDSYILAADGQLDELILSQFVELNFRQAPGLRRVSTGAEALALATKEPRYNLIITSMNVGDMDALALARAVRQAGLQLPVILLAYDARGVTEFVRRHPVSDIDRIFLWQGDVRLLLAIVNSVEDRWNLAHDTGEQGVQAVIVIEDNIAYYSSFLPAIYGELIRHSHSVAPEGVNLSHKLLRVQARPKILLCTTFDEAWAHFSTYEEHILGVISDIEFPKGGVPAPLAGVEFARAVRERQPDVPIMLQSSRPENEALARDVAAGFLLKDSPVLLHQLRQFMNEHFGFGDFVFRLPDGTEVARAHDLKTLEETLIRVPEASVAYHSERNHFSKWLKARTEFSLAHTLRPRKLSDFSGIGALRWSLVDSIRQYRQHRNRTVVADFDRATFDGSSTFYRMGGGSLGGKARGLSFVNLLLHEHRLGERFAGLDVGVPSCVVLGTDVFDRFLEENDLRDFALQCGDERALIDRFLQAPLPEGTARDLQAFVRVVDYPLAIRSSSLLEDSQYQPFAGIYDTFMLPNNHADAEVRFRQLVGAIVRVYASTFSGRVKAYLEATPYRLEEEKMAVILQRLVGSRHGDRFYPDFAGVARSHNYYPTAPMRSQDGIAAVALGLGATVVNGEPCVRFCPRYPRHLVQFSSVADALQNSQRRFYALAMDEGHDVRIVTSNLDAAEEDGTLAAVGSSYSRENDAIYDGLARAGVRLVTFAPVLKHEIFPLAEVLERLLDIGAAGTSGPVEIEFAVTLGRDGRPPHEFGFLQLRPLALSREVADLEVGDVARDALLCRSSAVLGHGRLTLSDVVVVSLERFERGRSQEVARDVARMNATLMSRGAPYLLIGVGRWGSREPLLGIPVTWDQIAGAAAIVEAGFRDFKVTPSQGTHFFQNLTASSVGYFTVNPEEGDGILDWEWLERQPASDETPYVRHLHFEDPIVVTMNGQRNEGVILKPGRAS